MFLQEEIQRALHQRPCRQISKQNVFAKAKIIDKKTMIRFGWACVSLMIRVYCGIRIKTPAAQAQRQLGDTSEH